MKVLTVTYLNPDNEKVVDSIIRPDTAFLDPLGVTIRSRRSDCWVRTFIPMCRILIVDGSDD